MVKAEPSFRTDMPDTMIRMKQYFDCAIMLELHEDDIPGTDYQCYVCKSRRPVDLDTGESDVVKLCVACCMAWHDKCAEQFVDNCARARAAAPQDGELTTYVGNVGLDLAENAMAAVFCQQDREETAVAKESLAALRLRLSADTANLCYVCQTFIGTSA